MDKACEYVRFPPTGCFNIHNDGKSFVESGVRLQDRFHSEIRGGLVQQGTLLFQLADAT